MNKYLTHEEQLETLKEWWKNYGKTTLAAVIIAAIASFGWRYWKQYKVEAGQKASNLYEQMLVAESQSQPKEVQKIAFTLFENYDGTPYAKLGQLIVAKLDVKEGNLADAEQKLLWVMQDAKSSQLRQIARLRVARVMLAQKKYKEALEILNTVDDKNYVGAIAEIKGDIYTAQEKKDLAREEYQNALQQLPQDSGNYALVQMKLADL